MPKFFYHLPGELEPSGPVTAKSKREARARILKTHGFPALPRGLKVWREKGAEVKNEAD